MPESASQYTLGASQPELERLIALASHEEDHVIEACRRANVQEGATAIDVGCGPLGALSALCRVVGKSGMVVGIDASTSALEKAQSLLPRETHPQLRLLHADINALTPDQAGVADIDLAYSRLMLLHQVDPARALANIARVLRPGGVFIAHEPSDQPMHAPSSEPHVPAMTRVWELVIAAARARGAQTDFGRRGRAYLEAAGFTIESHRTYFVHYPPEVGYDIPRVALRSLRPVLIEHALADDVELDRLDHELEDAKRRDDVQWVTSPRMIEWIARRGARHMLPA
jgi:ubiquinone/menaquinone biosynthesis C-methylase UbiE